jgi:hypothetical protein
VLGLRSHPSGDRGLRRFNQERFNSLLTAIRDWNLFMAFNIIDGCTLGKSREPLRWLFRELADKAESNFSAADIIEFLLDWEMTGRSGFATTASKPHRSISPITISNEPTMAGMSAMRHPAQSGAVTDRLQNDELLARARKGLAASLPMT